VQLPVAIPLRPSRRLSLVLALAHIGALAVVWPISLPLSYKGLVAAGVAVSAWLALRRTRYAGVSALHLGKAGELEIETKVGARDTATVLPQTTVLPGLVVLLLRRGRRTLALLLPTDATGRNAHRQLRLWLRWHAASS
jgi:toxin CptA